MASTVPIVKQIAWISLIPHVAVVGILIFIYYVLHSQEPVIYGALTYLCLSFLLRNFIAKEQRAGMRLVKQHRFLDAIPRFQRSVDFFAKYEWLDKYRFLTLLSSSKMSYREMGLCNIAFCYSQANNGQKAKEYYEKTVAEFPENGIAIAALRMIRAGANADL